ncbi:MAG TPA: UrcA family protein [Steroidobacteraceae bacterium]|nr:UrcA family protein [Steroidobacteraceae bacterium]
MNKSVMGAAAALAACALFAGSAMAQQSEEITVTASRIAHPKVVTAVPGTFMKDISLSYGVSTAGLDLTRTASEAELERRVNDAALAACKDIEKDYPMQSQPSVSECASNAAGKAMVQVHALIAAANKAAK